MVMSSGRRMSSKAMPYCMPEQPPPLTKMRSASWGLPSLANSSLRRAWASEVSETTACSITTWMLPRAPAGPTVSFITRCRLCPSGEKAEERVLGGHCRTDSRCASLSREQSPGGHPTAATLENRLKAVDVQTLTALVGNALVSKTLKVVDWQYQAIHAGIGGGVGGTHLYRFAGSARDLDETVKWTLILKILNAQSDADSAGSHYWRREAEAYRSGLLDELPSGLAAPRCFGVIEYANESCWLWLEDFADDIARWPLERYGLAAYHLGRFNGLFVTTRTLPTWPWFSASWIRSDIKIFGAEVGRFRDNLGRPLMRRFLPGDAAELLLRLWAEHETFMAALDGLPQTLCHFDAFRRNLFAKS